MCFHNVIDPSERETNSYCKPLTLHGNVNKSHSLGKLCHPGIKSILVWCPTLLPVVHYSIQCPSPPVLTNQGTPTVILARVLTTFSVACTQNVASDAVPIRLCATTVAGGRQETSHQQSPQCQVTQCSPVGDQGYLSLVQYLRRPPSPIFQVAPSSHSADRTLWRLLGSWGYTDWFGGVAQSHWVF